MSIKKYVFGIKKHPFKLVGKNYPGLAKWASGGLAPNGLLYFTPYLNNKVLEFNPLTYESQYLGSEIDANEAYLGAVLSSNGKLYASPLMANKILEIDPILKTTNLVGIDLGSLSYKWFGGCLATNDKIYYAPYNHHSILEFDPYTYAIRFIKS